MDISIRNSVLSEILINDSEEAFFAFIKSTFELNDDSFESYRRQINQFIINHDLRWKKKSKGRKAHFYKQYAAWLQEKFTLKIPHKKKDLKPFDQCSVRTKKRRLAMQDDKPGSSFSTKKNKRLKM